MSNLSPSVSIIEQDQSMYSVTSSSTVLAVVGYASMGPINTATMLTSYSQFQQVFGYPTSIGYSNLAVQNAFQNGNQVIFYRVAETTGIYATTQAQKVITNGAAAVQGYTPFTRITDVLPGTGGFVNGGVYDFNVTPSTGDVGATFAKTFFVDAPYSGRWAQTDVLSQINAQIPATYGYQEFGTQAPGVAPTIVPGTYSFKMAVSSASAWSGGSLSFDVAANDTLTSISSTINSAMAAGTRGNVTFILFNTAATPTTAVGFTGSSYNFTLTLDGGSAQTISVNGVNSNTTYSQLVAIINAWFLTYNINAICSFSTISAKVGIFFASKTRGITSILAFGAGTLFTSIAGGVYCSSISPVPIAGAVGILTYPTTSYVVSVGVNSYTGRIRLTTATVGAITPGIVLGSSITILPGVEANDFIAGTNFMGGVGTARYGQAAAGIAASLDSNNQIRISAATSLTSPTIVETTSNYSDTIHFLAFYGLGTAVAGSAAVAVTSADMIQFIASQYGSSGNLIQVVKTSSINPAVMGVATAVIGVAGSNYIAGDVGKIVTLLGGNGDASVIITTVSGGVTGINLIEQGTGYSTGTYSTTGSTTGSGLTVTITVAAVTVHTVQTYYNRTLQETFSPVSLTVTDPKYFATVMNAALENGGSSYVDVNAIPFPSPTDGVITFPNGTYTLGLADVSTEIAYSGNSSIGSYNYKPGTDGIPSTGDPALFVAALSSSSDLANADYFNYHILITPDDVEQPVQDAAIALANSRMDFVYIVDTPFGLSYSQVVAWHNGLGNGRTAAINSSYAAIYWPWIKTYDAYWGRYSWCPPSVFIASLYMQVDNKFNPWFAPAGNTRGVIVASDVETLISQPQRDQLYGGFNCVNPIVKFPSAGLVVYGQKTGLRASTALNRLNVRRMVVYMKKLMKTALNGMIFEPDNPDSWGRASDLITSILEPIRQGGGISQYVVTIDATTNPANVVAQNMMVGIIKIVPVSVIEVINMSLNVYQSGTVITG